MFFDDEYREPAALRDGRAVVLRLIRPEDKERLRLGFDGLSPESRYRRFFAVKTELSADELRYLTEVDGSNHFAIGAVGATDDAGLGVARFIRIADEPGVAEAAIAVADGAQGQGLGSLLFQRLIAAAAERGVARFRCEMLGTNAGMAELLRSLAPISSVEVASGVVCMEFALPVIGPENSASTPPRESSLFRLLTLVGSGALEWRARWQRLGELLWWGPPPPAATANIGEASHDVDDSVD
jgi:GNAT superfamily N-acetyltransferase